MNSRDNSGLLLPDAPKGKLLFEDDMPDGGRLPGGSPEPQDAPPTSGQVGQKLRRGRVPVFDADPELTRNVPANGLHFEDEPDGGRLPDDSPPSGEASSTSGQRGQKLKKRGGKLRQETEKARPSDRLRHDGEKAPPTPGAATAAPDGGRRPSAGDAPHDGPRPGDKKAATRPTFFTIPGFFGGFCAASLSRAASSLSPVFSIRSFDLLSFLPSRVVKSEAWMAVHGKIYQAENENVGVKAAHRTELAGEGAVRGGTRFIKNRIRTRPARQVRKWERKDIKARADHAFRTMARDNPDLKSNTVSRYMQKRRLRKQYRKQARDAAKTTGTLAQKAVAAVGKAGRAVFHVVAAHPASALIVVAAFLLIVTMQSCVGGALTIGNGIIGAISGTSYLAEDGDINAADLAYSEWEADLLYEAQNAESSHPGFDEYRFDIDAVEHDPIALISFLTAKYDNFTFAGVESALRDIFNQQYNLTFTEIVEVRYRTEYYTDEDGDEHSYEVPYNYYILQTTLTAQPFTDVIGPLLSTGDEQDRYDIYNITKGNRQYVGSPFPFDWRPYVSCLFGWRVHPITGAKDFHRGIDIAASAGTPILAGGDGVVVEATTHELYGLTVKIDYGDGIAARYSHCSALLVSAGQEVKAGDAIAQVGSTGASTGPHLDIEILKDGELLNPLYFLGSPF